MSNNVLVIEKLNKKIGKELILNNISFSIPKGKIVAFVGHNGAGKTTTIKSIMGLYRFDSGTITINGINTKKIQSHKYVGYVPEKENFPKISAKSFLLMMAGLYGVKRQRALTLIKHYEYVFSLKNRLHINLNSMSSGQKKKIMIIQSLLHEPDLLIMDEPTENLDPDTRDVFYKVVKKLQRQGKTLFISTHNLDEIQHHVNWVVIIVGGKIKKVMPCDNKTNLHKIYNFYKPKIEV
jgi:ABC-2 type transport system ATP-binding protein